MKITENLIVEESNLREMLTLFLRSYRHYNKGKMPGKIIIPYLKEIKFRLEMMPPEYATIPIEFEKEKADATRRPLRAEGTSKASGAVSPSSSTKPKPDKQG